MMNNNNKYQNISPEKFKLVQTDSIIKDVKFDTKPVGFFKDAFIRFRRNKSSVTAAIIIIFLFLFAIFAPMLSKYTTMDADGYYRKVLPKSDTFSALGWDGSKVETSYTNVRYDKMMGIGVEKNSNANNANYVPINKVVNEYSDTIKQGDDNVTIHYYDVNIDTYLKVGFEYDNLIPLDYFRLQAYQNVANIQVLFPLPQNYAGSKDADLWYKLVKDEYWQIAQAHYKASEPYAQEVGTAEFDENGEYVADYLASTDKYRYQYYSDLRIDGDDGTYTFNKITANSVGNIGNTLTKEIYTTPVENTWYTYAYKNQTGYKVRVLYNEYYRYKRTNWSYAEGCTEASVNEAIKNATTDEDYKAILNMFEFDLDSGFYAEFLFGTDDSGKDIFTLLGSGARLSFLLAIFVSAINLTIGAFYGAVEGYYGGAVDMILERVSDVLSGVPFIVVATLFNLHLAKIVGPLVSLLFAFVTTGWIGMASRVRMQFYRFKGQEYILSARTLGASDFRIMFKHIFPNAIGTIITGSILSIPGVIFSESMLSYLNIINLETSGFTSVGTLLSNGSTFVGNFPHIIAPPAIFISLLMISFNLFGNGLRDAFNPSLRGAEE